MPFTLHAASSFMLCPPDRQAELFLLLGEGLHPADFWQPKDLTKPAAIADVRDVTRFASRSPVGHEKRAVIHGADLFKAEVANALLKLLEEPPAYLKVVLLAERDRLLPTVRSRVRHLAGPVDFATMGSAWTTLFKGYDLGQPVQRQAALDALHLAPLLHAGIKEASLLEPLTQQQRFL